MIYFLLSIVRMITTLSKLREKAVFLLPNYLYVGLRTISTDEHEVVFLNNTGPAF